MTSNTNKKALLFALAIISVVALAEQLYVTGPGWDLIAHYMNGKSLDTLIFYSCAVLPQCALRNGQLTFWYGTYFEPYRAPLSGFIFAVLALFSGQFAITAYAALVFAGYLLAVYLLGKQLEIDSLLMYALMLSPVILYTSLIAGSEEMVSLIFLLIGLSYLAKRSALFGLFLGLACLGKYPTLILLPMLLLLAKPKKIAYGSALFFAATVPWLAFNQVLFHNALASYSLSMQIASYNVQAFWISPAALFSVLLYGIVFGAITLMLVYPKRRRIMRRVRELTSGFSFSGLYRDDTPYYYAILLAFVALSVAAFLLIGPYYDSFTQARYGYLLATSTALVAAMALNGARKYTKADLRIIVPAVSILLLVLALLWYLVTSSSPLQLNANSNVFPEAKSVLSLLGYGNCRIVTNDWVYMLYRNVSAFPQFYYNATTERYPILAFYNQSAATSVSSIMGLPEAKVVYASKDFSVLLPENSVCYK